MALACSKSPKGRPLWTPTLLEGKVVGLKNLAQASDNDSPYDKRMNSSRT